MLGVFVFAHPAGDDFLVAADNARLPERFLFTPAYAPGQLCYRHRQLSIALYTMSSILSTLF